MQTALQLSMRAIQHENVDVRIHALTSLKEMIYKNQVRSAYNELKCIISFDAKRTKHLITCKSGQHDIQPH